MFKFSRILAFALLLSMIFSMFTVTAFASEDTISISFSGEELDYIEGSIEKVKSNGKISTKPSWIEKYITIDSDSAWSYEPLVIVDGMDYGDGTAVLIFLKRDANLTTFKAKLAKELSVDSDDHNYDYDVGNLLEVPDLEPDTTSVLQMFDGFMPIINVLVGLLTTLIAIGMTIFTAFDVAYIAFPVVREKCEEAKVSGNGAMTKQGKNGQTELRFVSDDAQYAVRSCSVDSGQSPWWPYFKRRIMSYIMLAIILFILVTGNIDLITNIVLNVVSGIMEVLQGLGA